MNEKKNKPLKIALYFENGWSDPVFQHLWYLLQISVDFCKKCGSKYLKNGQTLRKLCSIIKSNLFLAG